eukprot:805077-Prymnesium_polylepis.1
MMLARKERNASKVEPKWSKVGGDDGEVAVARHGDDGDEHASYVSTAFAMPSRARSWPPSPAPSSLPSSVSSKYGSTMQKKKPFV